MFGWETVLVKVYVVEMCYWLPTFVNVAFGCRRENCTF